MLPGFPSSANTIWECALACALRRSNKKCRYRFGNHECYDCKLYIRKYSDADDRAVQLLMVQAECEASGIKVRNRSHHFSFAIWVAIFLILTYFTWSHGL